MNPSYCLNQKQQILQEIKWMLLRELSERDRVYLWSAGLLGIPDFLEEIENWGDDVSYPFVIDKRIKR
jgi:hypothetical protein